MSRETTEPGTPPPPPGPPNRFGDDAYAAEVVAELSAAFTCADWTFELGERL